MPTHIFLQYTIKDHTYRIIYRRYAGLFFSLCVDLFDNELAHLEAIHLFVEVLDTFFGNVCEMDIIFHFAKVRKSFPWETDVQADLCTYTCAYNTYIHA